MKFLLALIVLATMTSSTKVDLVVHDSAGAPVKDELVIVQDLYNQEHEVLRVLTDAEGKIPILDLRPGLYRAIGTAPYGLWQTQVQEFMVGKTPMKIELSVRPISTHGNGDIATAGTKKKRLKVLKVNGQPVSGAEIYVRDRGATLNLERRYVTNTQGEVDIELTGDPTIVAVVVGEFLTTRETNDNGDELTVRLPSSTSD